MGKQDRDETKLDLGEGFLADKLTPDSEMNADLAKFLQRRQLDFRCAGLQSRFQDREREIPGIHIFRHPPIDNPRIRITHDPRHALAALAGSEQLVFWSVCLFAHKS